VGEIKEFWFFEPDENTLEPGIDLLAKNLGK